MNKFGKLWFSCILFMAFGIGVGAGFLAAKDMVGVCMIVSMLFLLPAFFAVSCWNSEL